MAPKRLLPPEEGFPQDLSKVPDTELEILNSRILRQVEREYLQLGSPDPETEFRSEELRVELDAHHRRSAASEEATRRQISSRGSRRFSQPKATSSPRGQSLLRIESTRSSVLGSIFAILY